MLALGGISLLIIRGSIEVKEMEKVMADAEKILKAWEPTRIHFGEGTALRVGEVVKRYGRHLRERNRK
jgi:hypothetical protein